MAPPAARLTSVEARSVTKIFVGRAGLAYETEVGGWYRSGSSRPAL